MAISRVLGASLVSDLDRQGVDLQFTTSGNALVYMDFANFRLGINETEPQQALHLNGNLLVANGSIQTSANLTYSIGEPDKWFNTLYVNTITATTFTSTDLSGILLTNAQPNITSLGTLTGLTVDGNLVVNDYILPNGNVNGSIGSSSLWWAQLYSNVVTATEYYGTIMSGSQPGITNLSNVSIENLTISEGFTFDGNLEVNRLDADEIYDNGNRVLTEATEINITGDATALGTVANLELTLVDTGVTAGIYGSADDEYADRIPKITVDSKGRITNIANVTLTQVGNVTFNDTTISANTDITIGTVYEGNIYLSPSGSGIVYMVDTDAVKIPTGDTSQRPNDPEEGYFRYNVDSNSIEFWNGDKWYTPGVTPISSQVITPDGITDTYTLLDESTSESLLVMINGTLQQPLVSYQVVGNLITFSEAPLTTDIIEVRNIASGATTVTGLAIGSTSVTISPGNVNISGNLIPSISDVYDLGSSSKKWKDLYLSGNVSATYFIGDGSQLTGLPAGYTNSNVAAYLPTHTGNISATYFIGDGSQLTGALGGNLAVASLVGTLAVSQGGTGATTPSTALDNLLPSGEQTGYVLKTSGPGTYYWSGETGGGGVTVGQELTTVRQSNVATAGQTVFDLAEGISYTPGTGQLRVYIDGVRQHPDAYTETSNVSYTLSSGVSAGTNVFAEIDQFSTFDNFANLVYASNVGNIQADGLTVQAAIESLENNKAPLASPVFTGNVSAANFVGNVTATNITGTILTASQPNITGLGTITSGTWSADTIAISRGGTGATTTSGVNGALDNLLPSGEQTGYVLATTGAGSYFWTSPSTGGTTVGQQLTTQRQSNAIVSNTTVINLSGISYTPGAGQLRVYVNGVRQFPAAYTETSNVSYTLSANVVSGDTVFTEIDQFSSFNNFANLTFASNIGNIAAVGLTVQSAIDSLETNKAPLASPVFTGTVSGVTASMVGLGNVTNESKATMFSSPTFTGTATANNLTINGLTTLAETTETLDTKSSVTGTVVHDFSTTAIWYYSSISGNVTANFTNVPTTNNRITSVSIVINQGGTGYIVNGLQIDGAAQTIRWQANTVPTASTNRVDVFTFSLLRAADAWTVLGSATSHG